MTTRFTAVKLQSSDLAASESFFRTLFGWFVRMAVIATDQQLEIELVTPL